MPVVVCLSRSTKLKVRNVLLISRFSVYRRYDKFDCK